MNKKLQILLVSTFLGFSAFSQDEITGIWMPSEGKSKVEIYEQSAGVYAGKIVWMERATNRKGEPFTDRMNPDKSLRDRPLMGVHILEDLTYNDGVWNGTIYSPKKGKTLDAEVSLDGSETLDINVSFRGFSFTQTWTRTTLQ